MKNADGDIECDCIGFYSNSETFEVRPQKRSHVILVHAIAMQILCMMHARTAKCVTGFVRLECVHICYTNLTEQVTYDYV